MYHNSSFSSICLFWTSYLLLTSAAPGAEPEIRSVRADVTSIGLYEKFELRIDLAATFDNPFDAEQIDLSADFTSPSGATTRIWGFYNPSSWEALWMVRFAPTERGEWTYAIHATDRNGTARSETRTFTVVDSSHHGFVQIASNNRYLRHRDGTSCYPVGMWYNDAYEQFGQGNITESGLDELTRHGANFICFFPTPLETMGTGLGHYDQNRCGRLDQIFEWCEQRNLLIAWNVWFHSYISEAVWGGGNARYRNNPYRLVATAAEFFGSEAAWRYQEQLYRYIIARWGYSRALFLWFVIDEINGTEGWLEGDRDVAEAWCGKVHRYLKEHDPYQRPTTGTQSGGIRQWWPGGYRIFDIANREVYEAQGHPMPSRGKVDPISDNPLRFSYRNYATQVQNLWFGFDKPAMLGECGWDHTYYEPGMPEYFAMYHNAIWASLANGACATPFWWSYSERLNEAVLTEQLRHFANFVARIDFAQLQLEPAEITAGECDAWALRDDRFAFGWVVNPSTSVANETFEVAGLPDGQYRVSLYRTWRGRYLEPQQISTSGGRLTVTIPELRTTQGHASHIGHDVAFRIEPAGNNPRVRVGGSGG